MIFIAGGWNGEMSCSSGAGLRNLLCVATCKGFKRKSYHVLLYARVLRKFLVFNAIRKGFKAKQQLILLCVAICKGFKRKSYRVLLYARVLREKATTCCYMQGF